MEKEAKGEGTGDLSVGGTGGGVVKSRHSALSSLYLTTLSLVPLKRI